MHLAYSAISAANNINQEKYPEQVSERLLRYKAYQTACDKYRREIAAIQKYLPGWVPQFR